LSWLSLLTCVITIIIILLIVGESAYLYEGCHHSERVGCASALHLQGLILLFPSVPEQCSEASFLDIFRSKNWNHARALAGHPTIDMKITTLSFRPQGFSGVRSLRGLQGGAGSPTSLRCSYDYGKWIFLLRERGIAIKHVDSTSTKQTNHEGQSRCCSEKSEHLITQASDPLSNRTSNKLRPAQGHTGTGP